MEMEDFKLAREFLVGAEKIAYNIEAKENLLVVTYSFAELELAECNYKKCRVCIMKALRLAEQLHSLIGKARTLLILARTNTNAKAWQNAENDFRKVFNMLEKMKRPYELARAYYFYAQLKRAICDAPAADEYLKKAKDIFRKTGAKVWLKKIRHLKNT